MMARILAMGGFDAQPGAIARPAHAEDVRLVVSIARDAGIELAMRSGGHSSSGHGTSRACAPRTRRPRRSGSGASRPATTRPNLFRRNWNIEPEAGGRI